MFAPLIMVFAFGALINRAVGRCGAAVLLRLRGRHGPVARLDLPGVHRRVDRADLPRHRDRLRGPVALWLHHQEDLSGFGTFLMMGLIGLIVASIVNIFLASSALAFAISVIGVLIFSALTAYDTQNIKNTYLQHAQAGDQEWLGKAAIMGALTSTSTSSTCSCSCCSSGQPR